MATVLSDRHCAAVTTPVQSDVVWRRLYEVAAQIHALAPWERYPETDVFGVQHPASGVTDYVSLMGELGTHKAVALYLGSEGWQGFWHAQSTAPDPESRPEEILEVPHLQLAFGGRNELLPQETALLKRLGLRFKGHDAWPSFRSYMPGLYPWPLSPSEQARILPALLQVIELHDTLDDKLGDRSQGEDEPCLVRVQDPTAETWHDEWRPVAPPTPPIWTVLLPEDLAEAYVALPATDLVIELDLFMSPRPCREPGHERPVWPYLMAAVDAGSGYAFRGELLSPLPSFHQMWEQVPAVLLRCVLESRIRPAAVRVRSPRLVGVLKPVAKRLGLKVRAVRRLPAADMLRTSYLGMLDGQP